MAASGSIGGGGRIATERLFDDDGRITVERLFDGGGRIAGARLFDGQGRMVPTTGNHSGGSQGE